MRIKTKVFYGIFCALIMLSVSASYYRFMVLHDYIIQNEVDCDPTYESCFVWECDSDVEECTGNPDEDIWYYKIAYRNAKNIPACDAGEEACDQFTCPEGGEAECNEVLCTPATLEEHNIDQACTLPENFANELIIEESEENVMFDAEIPSEKTIIIEESTTDEIPADNQVNIEI
ncbi:hypothetical protein IPH92_01135 [Candidatus Kaiserbacteria bacterium]|nr:MAG: hypothetical protein IPH92_01135 [Candidatus Kaiserbacteria bacterium]